MRKTVKKGLHFYVCRAGLLLFLAVWAGCFSQMFSMKAEARVTQKKSGYSLTVEGVDEKLFPVDESGEGFFTRYFDLNPKQNYTENNCKYKVKFSITFQNLAQTPDTVDARILGQEVSFEKRDSRKFSASFDYEYGVSSVETMFLTMDYGREMSDQLPIAYDFKVEIIHQNPTVRMSVYGASNIGPLYPSDTDSFTVEINDPSVSSISKSKVKVTSSNKSVVKVAKKSKSDLSTGTSQVEVTLKGLKAGTSKITVSYKNKKKTFKVTVKKSYAYLTSLGSETLTVGDKTSIYNYINARGKFTLKNLKSSKPSVVSVSGKDLRARKTGKSVITFTLNGKKQKFTISVVKKQPVLKDLSVRFLSYYYDPDSMRCYYKIKLTNNSSSTITKVALDFSADAQGNDRYERSRTLDVKIKPGHTKTMTVYVMEMIDHPSDCEVKCTKFWYK